MSADPIKSKGTLEPSPTLVSSLHPGALSSVVSPAFDTLDQTLKSTPSPLPKKRDADEELKILTTDLLLNLGEEGKKALSKMPIRKRAEAIRLGTINRQNMLAYLSWSPDLQELYSQMSPKGQRSCFEIPEAERQQFIRDCTSLPNSPELLHQFSTLLGVVENTILNKGKLTDLSYSKNIQYHERFWKIQQILHRYDRNNLGVQEKLTYDILDHFLGDYLGCLSFEYGSLESPIQPFVPYPVNQLFGVQNNLPDYMEKNIHRVVDKKSAERYVFSLFRSVKFQNWIDELRLRERNGVTPPRFIIEEALEQTKQFVLVPPGENILFTSLKKKLQTLPLSESEIHRIEKITLHRIETEVYPAYQELIGFLEEQWKRATADAGVWKFPNGAAYYAACLSYHTTTNLSPTEVHELGLKEVERIEGEMQQILDQLGFKNQSIADSMRSLGQDARFLYPETEEGKNQSFADFQSIFEKIQNKLPELFIQVPKDHLQIKEVPELKRKAGAFAYYKPGNAKKLRPGTFYVNTHEIKALTKFNMPTLAYHEGIPGHHLQTVRAQLSELPIFRKIFPCSAYKEGWSLYCEKLAAEYEFITTPYDHLGRLQYELMRAARLVIDTGIHSKQWTREKAIHYMMETTGQNEWSVKNEIDRYIVLPGHACSYQIGMIKLLELRQKMKEQCGQTFDIREFHEFVLQNGAMPLSILENHLNELQALEAKSASNPAPHLIK